MEKEKYNFISVKSKLPPSGMYLGKDKTGREVPVIYALLGSGEMKFISLMGEIEITHWADLNEKVQ